MNEREYRIRKLSDGSGYIVLVLKGLHDVETLSKAYAKQSEARDAAKEHAKRYGFKPLIICE